MAAKMAVPNNKMAISLLISNLKQQKFSSGSLFSYIGNQLILVEIQCDNLFYPKSKMAAKMVVPNSNFSGHNFVCFQHRTMVFNFMNMFSYIGNQVKWISLSQ